MDKIIGCPYCGSKQLDYMVDSNSDNNVYGLISIDTKAEKPIANMNNGLIVNALLCPNCNCFIFKKVDKAN